MEHFCFLACFICQFSSINPGAGFSLEAGRSIPNCPAPYIHSWLIMDNEDTREYNLVSPAADSLSPSLNRNFLVVHIMNDFLISLFPQPLSLLGLHQYLYIISQIIIECISIV